MCRNHLVIGARPCGVQFTRFAAVVSHKPTTTQCIRNDRIQHIGLLKKTLAKQNEKHTWMLIIPSSARNVKHVRIITGIYREGGRHKIRSTSISGWKTGNRRLQYTSQYTFAIIYDNWVHSNPIKPAVLDLNNKQKADRRVGRGGGEIKTINAKICIRFFDHARKTWRQISRVSD